MKKGWIIGLAVAIIIVISIVIIARPGGNDNRNENSAPKVVEKAPEEVVEFEDENLEILIKDTLNIEEGNILGEDISGLWQLSIYCEEGQVAKLDGLEYVTSLEALTIKDCENIESLRPISGLPNLEYLTISYSNVEEIGGTFNTPMLARTSFIDTNIDDFEFIKNSTMMTDISISDSGVTNLDFLKDMEDLEEVGVEYSQLNDITGIEGKTKLTSFNIHKNHVVDISALESCISLETVNISYNDVVSLEPLYNLGYLMELTAYEEPMEEDMLIVGDHLKYLSDNGIDISTHRIID